MPKARQFADAAPLLIANAGPSRTPRYRGGAGDSSAVEVARFAAGDDDLVDKGMGGFVQKYGEGMPVCLNSRVTEVNYAGRGVSVAIDHLQMGNMQKVIIPFRRDIFGKALPNSWVLEEGI